ncbi:hypothetical protein ACWD3I_12205 [Streptomyces sp. NPDC002817]
MTTPHAGNVPETLRHRPAATPEAITINAADGNQQRPFHDRAEQVGRR